MKTKHTPGPWFNVAGMVETDDDRADICSCYAAHFGQSRIERSPHEEWANARLIAAAPDMLAALKEALHALNGAPNTVGLHYQIEAAIAKAEGQS